jgi:TonB family protein
MTAFRFVSCLALSIAQAAGPTTRTDSDSLVTQPASPHSQISSEVPCRNPDEKGKFRIGCGVTAPVVLNQPIPEYPDEARARKLKPGNMLLSLTVDTDGHAVDVHIKNSRVDLVKRSDRSAQRQIEDEALKAVRGYRFKPAMFQGRAVPVEMNVEINVDVF